MTDAGLSPDLLPGDARALYDELAAAGLAPQISEVKYSDGTVYRSIEDYLGYPTGANGELLVPVQYLWDIMLPETRRAVLSVKFPELRFEQTIEIANKTWHTIKPAGRPRLWRALLNFMRDESATVGGL